MTRKASRIRRVSFVEELSTGTSVVLVFWIYFESRFNHLFREGFRGVPSRLLDTALTWNSFVGARLKRFYKIVLILPIIHVTRRQDRFPILTSSAWPSRFLRQWSHDL